MWGVLLLGVLLTGWLQWQALHAQRVYSGQVTVRFVSDITNGDLRQADSGLIITAGLIGKRVNQSVSPDTAGGVSLVGEGVYHGYSVTLPNRGGQWVKIYDRPELDVQAAGTSIAEVESSLQLALHRIDEELAAMQAEVAVAPGNLIRTQLTPTVPDIREGLGSAIRAKASSLLLGGGLTLAGVVLLDRRRFWRVRPVAQPVA
jgi:hypothetical protein